MTATGHVPLLLLIVIAIVVANEQLHDEISANIDRTKQLIISSVTSPQFLSSEASNFRAQSLHTLADSSLCQGGYPCYNNDQTGEQYTTSGYLLTKQFLDVECGKNTNSDRLFPNRAGEVFRLGKCAFGIQINSLTFSGGTLVYGSVQIGETCNDLGDVSILPNTCLRLPSDIATSFTVYYSPSWTAALNLLPRGHMYKLFPGTWSCMLGGPFGWGHFYAFYRPINSCYAYQYEGNASDPVETLNSCRARRGKTTVAFSVYKGVTDCVNDDKWYRDKHDFTRCELHWSGEYYLYPVCI